jgi:hypothetical protein
VTRKVSALLCFFLLASMTAVAGEIPFGGSGSSGVVNPGQPFASDGGVFEPDWGIPAVGDGLSDWNGPTVSQFTDTLNLAPGIAIDPLDLGTSCNRGSYVGTVFCASPYSQRSNGTTLTPDSITFTAIPGGDLLINGGPFVVNIPSPGADLSGDFVTPVPEPSGFVLFGSAILGLAGVFRRKLLL